MRTPLYSFHATEARHMISFHGWEMPLYFKGIVAEHRTVRSSVGLFDVSHMGKIVLSGSPGQLQYLVPSTLPSKIDTVKYTHLLTEEGRIVDDLTVTCLSRDAFFFVCNAGATTAVLHSFQRELGRELVRDLTTELTCLALQGPKSPEVLERVIVPSPRSLNRFSGGVFRLKRSAGGARLAQEMEGWPPLSSLMDGKGSGDVEDVYVTRTGYTGEDGFELFAPNVLGRAIWTSLLEVEIDNVHVSPIGLGARDTLRLERGYLLSGQDFDGKQTPLEAGYGWLIDWDHDFIGREALLQLKRRGNYRRLMGLVLEGGGVPRRGNDVYRGRERVGSLTSGTLSPTLGVGIALGYLDAEVATPGYELAVDIRKRMHEAKVVKPPFI